MAAISSREGALLGRDEGRARGREGGAGGAVDLGVGRGGKLFLGKLGPVVVGRGRLGEERERGEGDLFVAAGLSFRLLERGAVDLEGAGEGLDGGEEPLLEVRRDELRRGLGGLSRSGEALGSQRGVAVEKLCEAQLGGVGREAVDIHLDDLAPREVARDLAEVALEAPDHDGVEKLRPLHRDAAAEAERVEQLEERGEAVRVAVVGRGREEEAVLEAGREVADGLRESRVDGVLRPRGGRGVVRLVEDEKRAGLEVAQPVAERAGVGLVAQERVREDEPRVSRERVDAIAPLAPAGENEIAVEDREGEAEAAVELVAPLEDDRGRAGDDDLLHPLPHEQLADDEPRLDRLAQAHVVRDEEADAGHPERLPERLELVGLDLDSGTEGGLHEARVGRGDAVPAEGVKVGREELCGVEAVLPHRRPARAARDGRVDLALPENGKLFALRVVVEAGEADERLLGGAGGRSDLLDEPRARADADELAGLGKRFARGARFRRRTHRSCPSTGRASLRRGRNCETWGTH